MYTKEYFIEKLNLNKHQEGGWYIQNYASTVMINNKDNNLRPSATSIHFMIDSHNFSAFHQLIADEMWYYHYGSPLVIVAIDLEGEIHYYELGLEANQQLQILIPAGYIFASYTKEDFSVVGCMVTPGFDYHDFKLFKASELNALYPQHTDVINKLCRD